MAASTGTMLGATGRRKVSPIKSTSATTSTKPKKSTTRPTSPRSQSRLSQSQTQPKPASRSNAQTKQVRKQTASRPMSLDDSDSDLTPQSSDNEDEDDSMQIEEDLTPKRTKKNEPTPKSHDRKGKGKEKAHEPVKIKDGNAPRGRERKRNTKLEEVERRRARDAKFDDSNLASSSTNPLYKATDDDASSFGDDESDHGQTPLVHHHADQDDMMLGLPDALAGQGIEDLAYGAGPEFELERHTLGIDWWGSSDDETEEDEEGIYIDHLSGSEAERQSVSTSHDSDTMMSDDEDYSSSSEEEQFDVYGCSTHPAGPTLPADAPDRPFIVMQNWKGELELVHTRPERSRSRKGDRGSTSRTAGSVDNSTVLSGEPELRIDPDEDSDASSWSGLSDEDEDGGNTTDSMDEDDMPMLDSPALQQLMGQPTESIPSPVEPLGPSIIVTDTSLILDPHTPALSTSSSNSNAVASAPAPPLTPGSAAPAVALPQMGTFHPVIDDPAQCAVIDGSKSATKSPFTHKRRNARGRKGSVTSSRSSIPERKRKSSIDLFSPRAQSTTHLDKLHKQARYSSIPGHPRYVKAKRAEAIEDGERTTSESDEEVIMSLEDMIETSVLEYEGANDTEHHSMRFDRVPVSTYMRRNILSSAGRAERALHGDPMDQDPVHGLRMRQPFSSPIGRGYGMTDTLVGPISGRGLIMSPVLAPVREGDEARPMSRKEKRRTARLGNAPPALQL